MPIGKLKMLNTQSPCLGCEKRVLHCRNECQKWAEYTAKADEERDGRVRYAEGKRIIRQYIRESTGRQRLAYRGKVRAKIEKKHR